MQNYDSKEKGYVRLELTHPVKMLPTVITGKELMIKYLILSDDIKKETTINIKFFNTLVQSLVEYNKKIEIIIELPRKEPIFLENLPSINVVNEKFDHIYNGIYPPGIMAIWAEKLTKKSLWKALSNRKCYGTTGPRVIIEFYLENHFMGDIINLKNNPNLTNNREIKIKVISPITLKR